MQSQAAQPNLPSDSQRYSNRILIAAMAGILFLTCFPFQFMSHARLPEGASRFLLGMTFGKHPGVFDDFLNVLLFVPLGFGLSEKLLEKGKSRIGTFFAVLIAGFFLSYAIEFTQLYIPGRDSGWEDVITNSSGSAAGFFLFLILGSALLRLLTRAERSIESLATAGRVAVVLIVYFACWFTVSARLQAETKLTDWVPDSRLLVGNDVAGKAGNGWKGAISKLEIWDRALPPRAATAVTGGAVSQADAPAALAAYDFTGGAPFRDRMKFLPDLRGPPARRHRGIRTKSSSMAGRGSFRWRPFRGWLRTCNGRISLRFILLVSPRRATGQTAGSFRSRVHHIWRT